MNIFKKTRTPATYIVILLKWIMVSALVGITGGIIGSIFHIAVDSIEDDTDHIQISLRHNLYLRESELNPIDAMFLYKVLDKIGDLADQAQRVGSRLELMISKT